jgi:hypothetical protein
VIGEPPLDGGKPGTVGARLNLAATHAVDDQVARERSADPTRMTVQGWLTTWLDAIRDEVAPKSHERYSEIVQNFLVPTLGNLRLIKLVPAQIQEAYNSLAVGGRRDGKEGGLAPRTRRHIHRILKSALSRAVKQQLLARNPADAIDKLPEVERREMTASAPNNRNDYSTKWLAPVCIGRRCLR